MISLLSKFKRPETVKSQAFSGYPLKYAPGAVELSHSCDDMQPLAVSCGVFERFYRNSNREKSDGGPTRCPVISVAHGICMTKAAPSNLLSPAWPKAGSCIQ